MEVATLIIYPTLRNTELTHVSTPFLPNGSRYCLMGYPEDLHNYQRTVSTPFLPNGSRYQNICRGIFPHLSRTMFQHLFFLMEVATWD